MNKQVAFEDLGFRDYKDVWDYQEQRFQEILDIKIQNRRKDRTDSTPNYFLFVEHPHVYTLGKSGDVTNLLVSEQQLTERGAQFYRINRGGDITYHGPGQLVVYPLVNIERLGLNVRELVCALERAVVRCVAGFGIQAAGDRNAPGVYIEGEKLASLGLRIRRGCAYHGLALNVDVDLEPFGRINPCGYQGLKVTRLADLGVTADTDAVAEALIPELLDGLGLTAAAAA